MSWRTCRIAWSPPQAGAAVGAGARNTGRPVLREHWGMAASVWRGRITFGLVSIPVRLVKAARHERTKFRRVQRVHAEEPDEPEASATPPRVLEFRSAPRNATPPPIHDHPPAEEAVVRVRNAPVSG